MDKDAASPPHYYSVAAPEKAGPPPPPVVLVAQPGSVEAQIGYDYQLQLMAKCARGEHQVSRKYGVVGIIFGVALFPVGMLAMLCDRKKKCDRCGLIIE